MSNVHELKTETQLAEELRNDVKAALEQVCQIMNRGRPMGITIQFNMLIRLPHTGTRC